MNAKYTGRSKMEKNARRGDVRGDTLLVLIAGVGGVLEIGTIYLRTDLLLWAIDAPGQSRGLSGREMKTVKKQLAFICFAVLATTAQGVAAQDLVIANARILDGNGGEIDQGTVVVRGGRIVSVSGGTADAEGATLVDARKHDGDAGVH